MPVPIALPNRPPSPCINVCRMNPAPAWRAEVAAPTDQALCEGCQRTIDEIANWSGMTEASKQVVWQQLDVRRHALADDFGDMFER